MFVLARALTWSALFVATVLVLLPRQLLGGAGVGALGPLGWAGIAVAAAGGALCLWCILAFATLGRGTPMPLDPPRRLVVRGPYRFVRNPMYLGAAIALGGAALTYGSLALLAYGAAFLVAMHLFVVIYEEPTLSRSFGADYAAYRAGTRRWLPGWPTTGTART